MNKHLILPANKAEYLATLGALYAIGYQWHRKFTSEFPVTTIPQLESRYRKEFPYILVRPDEMSISGTTNTDEETPVESLTQLLQGLYPKPIPAVTVKLNDAFEAVISDDGKITVGCQTFEYEAISNLYFAAWNMRDKMLDRDRKTPLTNLCGSL